MSLPFLSLPRRLFVPSRLDHLRRDLGLPAIDDAAAEALRRSSVWGSVR